jgi:hypothetical protein
MHCSYAWAKTVHLSLPLPLAVPATSTFHPIVSAVAIPLAAATLGNRYKNATVLSGTLSYILSLIPIVLMTLALIYSIPSQLSACSLESHWGYLFRTKNADAIRAIQSSLRCCGLNSMHDRAWPFPSNGIDARECERTQGWNVQCLDGWREQQDRTAGLVVVACVASWIFVVSHPRHAVWSTLAYSEKVILSFIAWNRLPWTRQSGIDGFSSSIGPRLLDSGETGAAHEQRRRLADSEAYADEPDSELGQAANGEQADDDRLTSGALGSNAAVRISSLHG